MRGRLSFPARNNTFRVCGFDAPLEEGPSILLVIEIACSSTVEWFLQLRHGYIMEVEHTVQ